MLNQEEHKRYNRHVILDQVGLEGQLKLKAAKVLVIGAGGLGCPVLQYLTAAGVGTIGIIDFDTVDLSNLQRQILFTTADVGKNKASCAAERLQQLNDQVKFEVYPERLTSTNALELFAAYDLIIDGTDNFSTRYLVNDAAVLTNKPLVYGSIYKFEGQVSVFNYEDGPTYRCLFPVPPKAGTIKNCSEIGVIGVLPGIIGTQQANEAIKIIMGVGKPLSGKLLIYDALQASYITVGIQRAEAEVQKTLDMKANFAQHDYDLFCGVKGTLEAHELSNSVFKTMLNDELVRIIDLREGWEEPQLDGSNVERIIMSDIQNMIERFKTDKTVVLVCQTGARSNNVRQLLKQTHQLQEIKELKGGMEQYGN
ncbi:MAG: molybdopterin-synthase adenylyltransferase MoeB [Crocinitomix sp.]|nr:molybdopterin-synthase adenylyltransferase MoeB [Crocinitomix sp.]